MGFFSHTRKVIQVFSDALGSWGCAAIDVESSCWFQIAWPETWKGVNIAIKEMIPVVASAALWGSTWESAQVHLNIDNQVVVAARCLFSYEVHFKFERQADHVPGQHNIAADALSRNHLTFHFVCPQAQSTPTHAGASTIGGSADGPIPELDIHTLETDVHRYFVQGIAKSTMSTYTSAQKSYFKFCLKYSLTAFPLSERQACLYVAYLAERGLHMRSISVYLAALRYLQVSCGEAPGGRNTWYNMC